MTFIDPFSGKGRKPAALFIGRWQAPNALHDGHIWCFEQKLSEGIPVVIAIRDVEQDEKNPYTAHQVEQLIHKHPKIAPLIESGQVRTLIIPDIEGVYYGRDVGYKVEQLIPPADVAAISGTALRNDKKTNI